MTKNISAIRLFLVAVVVSACDGRPSSNVLDLKAAPESPAAVNPPIPDPIPPTTPTPTPTGSVPGRLYTTDALIFNGDGAWSSEAVNLEGILKSHGLTYSAVSSAQIDAMTDAQFATYGMFVWPGGSGSQQLSSLTDAARTRIRNAVVDTGLGFVGFCAGAFLAVSPAPASGQAPSWLSLIPQNYLNYYYLENQGVTAAMTLETFADGTQHDLVWYGGPVTPNIAGGIVAKYPTGEPAISETKSGNGFVIVSGVHPASPALGIGDTDGLDFDVAWSLLHATLTQTPLPAF